LLADGVEVVGSSPEHLGRVIAEELKLWSRIAREAGITATD
jgi:hypothetical protein